jgi:hypothetical protein
MMSAVDEEHLQIALVRFEDHGDRGSAYRFDGRRVRLMVREPMTDVFDLVVWHMAWCI